MKKLYITKGLPASGKTTWAKELQIKDPNTVRVNKDDLRAMLHSSIHSKGRENFVLGVRDFIVRKALDEGHNVVVDDTNLNPIHETRLREIAKLAKGDVQVIIQDFTDVTIDICIQRDKMRPNSVGEEAIRRMASQFGGSMQDISEIPVDKLWVISDTHFTHQMFVDEGIRPADYNERIMSNWNKLIPVDAIVIHLGDVIFGMNKERLQGILAGLNGTKYLVKGNHDYKPDWWWQDMGFEKVVSKLVWKDVLFTHIPEAIPEKLRLNIHGHLHGNSGHRREEVAHLLTKNHRLLALELNGYKPERLLDLIY